MKEGPENNHPSEESAPEAAPLTYVPFDAGEELKNIKNLPPEREDSPEIMKRAVRRDQVSDFKDNLMRQKEGIGKTIGDLRAMVESVPDASQEALMRKVFEVAPGYRFTQQQEGIFKNGVEQYCQKHLAVEKYREMYPDDNDLFEACFGRKPKGKLEVVKGPMTLCFRCFSENDYAFVRHFYAHGGDEKKFVTT